MIKNVLVAALGSLIVVIVFIFVRLWVTRSPAPNIQRSAVIGIRG